MKKKDQINFIKHSFINLFINLGYAGFMGLVQILSS